MSDHKGFSGITALKQSFRENQCEEKIGRSIVTGLLLRMEKHSPGERDISTRCSHKKEQFPGDRGVLARANKEPDPVPAPPKLAHELAHSFQDGFMSASGALRNRKSVKSF